MAVTETTNLKLQKPDGNEYVDVSVINNNMDKIDAAISSIYISEGQPTNFKAGDLWLKKV